MKIHRAVGVALATLAATVIVSGCAPAHYVDGLYFTAKQYHANSAVDLGVNGHGYLRFDHALQSDLDDAIEAPDLSAVQTVGASVLDRAGALAIEAADVEVDRMPREAIDELVLRYELKDAPSEEGARRTFLKLQFAARAKEHVQEDINKLQQAQTESAARRMLTSIRDAIEPAPGDRGRFARVMQTAPLFLPAVIGAEIADYDATERSVLFNFDQAVRYEPLNQTAPPTAAALESASPEELARWYAPVIVQQVNPDAEYAPEDDRFGRVYLTGSPDNIRVHIDTSMPVVYWATQQAKIHDQRYDQLVYVAWYPRRPAMGANDPSAGEIDGAVIRITLDHLHRPAIYEYVRSCGCYHTLWVAEFVEAEARSEFAAPGKGRRYAVQRTDVPRQLFIPAIVPDDGAHPHRPATFISAGYHMGMSIRPMRNDEDMGYVQSTRTYALQPYESLTKLPLGDGVASMFGSDGLVHNAGRTEGWLLAPTGMLSAGQPRQLGTMKIRMDAYDYDNPRLLEQNLRLPHNF